MLSPRCGLWERSRARSLHSRSDSTILPRLSQDMVGLSHSSKPWTSSLSSRTSSGRTSTLAIIKLYSTSSPVRVFVSRNTLTDPLCLLPLPLLFSPARQEVKGSVALRGSESIFLKQEVKGSVAVRGSESIFLNGFSRFCGRHTHLSIQPIQLQSIFLGGPEALHTCPIVCLMLASGFGKQSEWLPHCHH